MWAAVYLPYTESTEGWKTKHFEHMIPTNLHKPAQDFF